MLAGAGGAVDRRADVTRDVDRGQSDPSTGVVDQHGLARLERAHDDEQLPRGEIRHRKRGSLFVREPGRLLEDLRHRHRDDVRIASEVSESDDILADHGVVDPGAHRVRQPRDFIADHGGKRRRIGIQTLTGQDVGEVDAARLDANPHLPRPRLRVGSLPYLELLRPAMTDDDDLLHDDLPANSARRARPAPMCSFNRAVAARTAGSSTRSGGMRVGLRDVVFAQARRSVSFAIASDASPPIVCMSRPVGRRVRIRRRLADAVLVLVVVPRGFDVSGQGRPEAREPDPDRLRCDRLRASRCAAVPGTSAPRPRSARRACRRGRERRRRRTRVAPERRHAGALAGSRPRSCGGDRAPTSRGWASWPWSASPWDRSAA